jgi:hypothetical protein
MLTSHKKSCDFNPNNLPEFLKGKEDNKIGEHPSTTRSADYVEVYIKENIRDIF